LTMLAVPEFSGHTASAQRITAEEAAKAICGTWINTNYRGDLMHPQKIVFLADRTYETYNTPSQESTGDKGDFNILDSWKDTNGYTYLKVTTKSIYQSASSFELWRVDKSGEKWESQYSFVKNNFAKEIVTSPDSSKGFSYSIFFRQPNDISPVFKDSMIIENHTQYIYATVDGKPLKAYVFQPAHDAGKERRGAIAIFHGGGWVSGEPGWGFRPAEHFASLGMVAVAIQYRLSDQLSITPLEALADARAAIRWMRSNAARLGIDPDRIAAYGWSAGAHLAASVAIFADDRKDDTVSASPNALILLSPAVELESDGWTQQLLGARADASSISPASHVRKGLPPTLILQGRHDTVTPLKGVQLFSDRMRAAGNDCTLQIYEGVGHLFTPDSIPDNGQPQPDKKIQADAQQKMDEFLSRHGFFK
jgi:acetyl esterase